MVDIWFSIVHAPRCRTIVPIPTVGSLVESELGVGVGDATCAEGKGVNVRWSLPSGVTDPTS
jgi:hypothetical protein